MAPVLANKIPIAEKLRALAAFMKDLKLSSVLAKVKLAFFESRPVNLYTQASLTLELVHFPTSLVAVAVLREVLVVLKNKILLIEK